jgi:hypothetical protein
MRANFNSTLNLSSDRRKVKVIGPLGWDPDGVERVEIVSVTIKQGTVQAAGASNEFKRGEGNLWWCDAETSNGGAFVPGEAVAEATARQTRPSPQANLFTWPQTINLHW